MKKIVLLNALLLSAGTALRADFEGILHMKYTTPQGGGTATMSISKKGMRNEASFRAGPRPITFTTLVLHAEPHTVYMIDDQNKTYSVMDTQGAQKQAEKVNYTVKDLGMETVQGYRTKHVLITHPGGGESELWTSRDILDYAAFAKTQGADKSGDNGASFMKALKDAGADGFPVKSIHRGSQKGPEMVTELVKAEKKSLPASLFQVPAGYAKSDPAMGPAGAAMPPETRKAMEEQMKKLSPEQRKMFEEMMKGKRQN
jgi:hypothetical protein